MPAATKEHYTTEIATTERLITACEFGISLTHKIAERTYTERDKDRRALHRHLKKLKQKLSRLQTSLIKLTGPIIHKDIFNQDLKVGAAIAWSPSGRYAGATVGYVSRSTPKMIQMVRNKKNVGSTGSNIYPQNVIVVDKLIKGTVYDL